MKTQFLRELIEKNARVILPDFGAFLVKDDGTSVFKPENITFSPFLRYNDGMVEDALAAKQKVSKDKAKEALTKYVEELKAELQSKKVFVISELGSLYIDKRGSIQFSTDESLPSTGNTTESSPPPAKKKEDTETVDTKKPETPIIIEEAHEEPLELDIKDEKEVIPHSEPVKVKKIEKETILEITEPIAPAKPTESKPTKQETHKTKEPKPEPTPTSKKASKSSGTGMAILYGTLIGVGFVAILATGWYLYSNGVFSESEKTIKTLKQETQATPEIESPSPAAEAKFDDEFEKLSAEMDEVDSNPENDEAKTVPKEKRFVAAPPAEDHKINMPAPRDGMFHLIAGSFRNAEYAEKFSADMASLGYNSKVVLQPTGMYAVSLGSFIDRQQAVDSMNVWKQNLPNIWILQQ
ncbi:MAG: SPOR domain-containing protein [Bacteroidales bacterium]